MKDTSEITLAKANALYERTKQTYFDLLKEYIDEAGSAYRLAKAAEIPLSTIYAVFERRSLTTARKVCERVELVKKAKGRI